MLESPVRVALLARPGDARDQLRRALADLGAHLVAEGDPAELDPVAVAGERPAVVLVSLEPALEDSLAPFEDLLATRGIEVMYDDAEVTRLLDGWDLARWARHLAAKLVGSDLLPPAPGGSDHVPEYDFAPEPGAPPTPAQEMAGERLEDYAAESMELSDWVPSEPQLTSAAIAEEPERAGVHDDSSQMLDLELDMSDLEMALGRMDAELQAQPSDVALESVSSPEMSLSDFDATDLEFDASALDLDLSALPSAPDDMQLVVDDEPLLADLELADGPVNFGSFAEDEAFVAQAMDDDVAAMAALHDAHEAQNHHGLALEPDFAAPPAPAAEPAEEAVAAPPPSLQGASFGSLSLVPLDSAEPEAAPLPPAADPRAFAPPVAASARLSLADVDASPSAAAARGAVLVLAGLGGPDAVRQLLASLPPSLPAAVLLYQHLDTGKHDRLVGQLAKASGLAVDLAVAGKLAFRGRVAVLPPGIGVSAADDSFEFVDGQTLAELVAALPAADCAVLVLSGADPAAVPAVLALQASGAMVLAQDPGSCFDPVAAQMAIAAGAVAATPVELSRLIMQRWH